jgi:hypothetical protein
MNDDIEKLAREIALETPMPYEKVLADLTHYFHMGKRLRLHDGLSMFSDLPHHLWERLYMCVPAEETPADYAAAIGTSYEYQGKPFGRNLRYADDEIEHLRQRYARTRVETLDIRNDEECV